MASSGEGHDVGGRLGLIDDALAEVIRGASDAARRRGLAAGVRLALQQTGLADPRLAPAERALSVGQVGAIEDRVAVMSLVEELDEAAWRIQDHTEAAGGVESEYVHAFRKARAAAAASYAFEGDSLVAVTEGLYEAYHAIDDPAALRTVVTAALA